MKRKIFLIIFFLKNGLLFSQEIDININFAENIIHSNSNFYKENSISVTEEIYPLGFSKTGLFCYVLKENAPIVPECYYSIVVMDINTDAIVEKTKELPMYKYLESNEYQDRKQIEHDIDLDISNNQDLIYSIDSFLKVRKSTIRYLLKKYSICNVKIEKISTLPEKINGSVYTSSIENFKNNSTDTLIGDYSYSIVIYKDKLKKIIYKRYIKQGPSLMFVKLNGYIKDPYSERIVVIYSEYHRGLENDNTNSFILSGCDLSKGFK